MPKFIADKVFAALSSSFQDIINGTKDFKEAVSGWFGGIGNWFTTLWNNLKSSFETSDTNTGNWFTNLITSITDFFAGIPEFFANFGENLKNALVATFAPEERLL